mmetsp:Transcript_13106/g.47821  ORF Transcript_13106/g.47821 Transcript_13106/m.47821 type:complete len:323 (-) Transcript_13106:1192-2160(-)
MGPSEAQVRRCGDPEGLSLPLDTLVQRAGKSQRAKRKRESVSGDAQASQDNGAQKKVRGSKKPNKRRKKIQPPTVRPQVGELEEGEINPSVKRLRKENRARAKRFFKQQNKSVNRRPRTPHGAPSAPQNSTQFIMRYNKHGIRAPLESPVNTPRFTPRVTPFASPSPSPAATPKRFGYEDLKTLGLDSFGSMHGLILKDSPQLDDAEVEDDSDGSSEEFEEGGHSFLGNFSAQHSNDNDRSRYIARLEEQNMNLRARMYLLEEQLKELARKVDGQLDSRTEKPLGGHGEERTASGGASGAAGGKRSSTNTSTSASEDEATDG